MMLKEAIDKAREELQAIVHLEVSNVTGASRNNGDGWRITIESVERKSIPDSQDLLGVYEVLLDEEGNMMSYERIRTRKRADIEEVLVE